MMDPTMLAFMFAFLATILANQEPKNTVWKVMAGILWILGAITFCFDTVCMIIKHWK